MNKIEDLDIVNYMINNDVTAKEVAQYYEISLSTVRKALARIKLQLNDNSSIKEELLNVISNNQQQGRYKGGLSHNSGRKRTVEIDFIASIAIDMLTNNLTIQETSLKYNIPTSTISDYFNLLNNNKYQEIYDDLESLFVYHKTKHNIENDKFVLNEMLNKYEFSTDENKKMTKL